MATIFAAFRVHDQRCWNRSPRRNCRPECENVLVAAEFTPAAGVRESIRRARDAAWRAAKKATA